MNAKQQQKLVGILLLLILISGACGLVLYALKQNINLFYTPSQLSTLNQSLKKNIRVGGYVKENSVIYDSSGEKVNFIITDRTGEVKVLYQGILPNLFREGQTVVITGHLNSNKEIVATQVLAKHDEKYMPANLKNELKKQQKNT